MTTVRLFTMNDLLKFNNINLDYVSVEGKSKEDFDMSLRIADFPAFVRFLQLTETYNMSFYMSYMSKQPEAFTVAESPNNDLMGYMLGKAEGDGNLWHGHVSAVTVAPMYRRLGLAKTLMDDFENLCIQKYNAYFVDLFVRTSNKVAQGMYEKFGYSTCEYATMHSTF
jgi:N-terminal acetyltransferase B complex catalytic subunit